MSKQLVIVYLFLAATFSAQANWQDISTLLAEGRQLEAAFRDAEALERYQAVLRLDPRQFTALCKVSELHSLLGKRQPTPAKEKEYYQAAENYAGQALAVNPASTESNFVMALAMGRMAIISSGEAKIKAVKAIRLYAEKCIQADPGNFKGYHILARWHYEVSDLNSLEKWLVKLAYGSLPPASLATAISYYEKSRTLNPGLLINYLELAKCYHRKEDDKKAIAYLNDLLRLPNQMADDPIVRKEAEALLKRWKD